MRRKEKMDGRTSRFSRRRDGIVTCYRSPSVSYEGQYAFTEFPTMNVPMRDPSAT